MASEPGTVGLSEEIARLAEQLQQLQAAGQSAAESTRSGSAAPPGNSGGQSIGSTLLDVFGTGLGLSPLISGLASLFGKGSDTSAPVLLTKFVLPPSIQVNGGVSESGGQAFGVDNPQGGLPRPAPTGGQAAGPAQITVQVQAMDSQSFLDHSADIAMAVRQAMLESSVLNDVVREA